MWIMLDSGAAISIWPRSQYPQLPPSHSSLVAVNGSRISTFGTKDIHLDIEGQRYTHRFVIAEVQVPILGWDFLARFKLDLCWRSSRCVLSDPKARRSYPLRYKEVDPSALQLAPVQSFQKYSQLRGQESKEPPKPFPTAYKNLLDQFPDIQKCNFVKDPAHGVVHHIDTGNNSPCKAKPRPLMPGTQKAILGEKSWRKLEELGIITKVDPAESNIWTSALHLVPKPDGSLRCTGDYRALNDKTQLDGYPLPTIRQFASQLKDSRFFSKVDLVKSFHQIPLDLESS